MDSDHVIRGGLVKFNCDIGIWMMIDWKFLTLNRLGLFQFRRSGLGSSLEVGNVLALAKTPEICLNFGGRSVVCFRVERAGEYLFGKIESFILLPLKTLSTAGPHQEFNLLYIYL